MCVCGAKCVMQVPRSFAAAVSLPHSASAASALSALLTDSASCSSLIRQQLQQQQQQLMHQQPLQQRAAIPTDSVPVISSTNSNSNVCSSSSSSSSSSSMDQMAIIDRILQLIEEMVAARKLRRYLQPVLHDQALPFDIYIDSTSVPRALRQILVEEVGSEKSCPRLIIRRIKSRTVRLLLQRKTRLAGGKFYGQVVVCRSNCEICMRYKSIINMIQQQQQQQQQQLQQQQQQLQQQ